MEFSEGHTWIPGKCRVCLEPSSGIHYSVETCEGCKAFFKRSLTKEKPSYRCYFGEKCVVGRRAPNRCKACRLKKCIKEGMKAPTKPKRSFRQITSGVCVSNAVPKTVTLNWPEFAASKSSPDDEATSQCLPLRKPVLLHSLTEPRLGASDVLVYPAKSTFQSTREETHQRYMCDRDQTAPWDIARRKSINTDLDLTLEHRYLADKESALVERICQECTRSGYEAYSDQLAIYQDFMDSILVRGAKPPKQVTAEKFARVHWESVGEMTNRTFRFLKGLAGLSLLNTSQHPGLMKRRGPILYIILHAPFTRNYDHYYLMKPASVDEPYVHFCRSMAEKIFDPLLTKFSVEYMEEISRMRFTQAEVFLLMAIALLRPAEDSPMDLILGQVHSSYVEALRRMFCRRFPKNWESTQRVIESFSLLDFTFKNHVAHLDISKLPCVPSESNLDVVPISECLRMLKETFSS